MKDKKDLEYINQIDYNDIFINNVLGRNVDSYLPFYDHHADYNTNAKSYYDYLARYNNIIRMYADLINRLLRRNIEVEDTNSIEFIKLKDWIDNGKCPPENFDDIITLLSNVKISEEKESHKFKTYFDEEYETKVFDILNSTVIKDDGIYSPDYKPIIDFIGKKLIDHEKWLEEHEKWLEKHENWLERLENWLERLQVQVNDNTININTIRGINLKELEKGKDYDIEFYNGFYAPDDDLIVSVGETSTTLDINITSHSTSGRVIKHDGDLREKTELSLRPDKDIPEKSKVFAIILKGDYAEYKDKEVALDNSSEVLWHIRPQKAGASWNNLLTPHNMDGKIVFNWRQISDGYGTQLRATYNEPLSLEWGNVDSKITLKKEG